MMEFSWKVHDRILHQEDGGEETDFDTLKKLIDHFRKRHNEATVLPE
jgi:hypothetical protein